MDTLFFFYLNDGVYRHFLKGKGRQLLKILKLFFSMLLLMHALLNSFNEIIAKTKSKGTWLIVVKR